MDAIVVRVLLPEAPDAPEQELEGEDDDRRVGDGAADEAEPRGVAAGAFASVQRVVDRPGEPPHRVGRQPDRDHDQHQLAEWIAGQEDQASRKVCGLARPDADRDAEGQQAHHSVKGAADCVPEALKQLQHGVGGGPLDGFGSGMDGCHMVRLWPRNP